MFGLMRPRSCAGKQEHRLYYCGACKTLGIPVIAICGSLGPDAGNVQRAGIAAFFSALEESIPEAELPRRGPGMLERCAEQVGRLLALKCKLRK